MPKVIESKFVIRGEDQGAQATVDGLNRKVAELGDTLKSFEDIKFFDTAKYEKIGHVLKLTTGEFQRFAKRPVQLEQGTAKIHESLSKIGKLPFMDVSIWERIKSRVTGIFRETEKLRNVQAKTAWTGRAAEILRRQAGPQPVEAPSGEAYKKMLRQQFGEELPEFEGRGRKRKYRSSPEQEHPDPDQKPKPEPPWAKTMRKFFEKIEGDPGAVAQVAGGLITKIGAGGAGAGSMLGLGALGAVAGIGMAAGLAWKLAESMAQPYIEYQKTAAPLFYTSIGKKGVEEARATGVGYGYEPTEMAGFQRRMYRVGGAYAPEQFAKLRYGGLEMEEALPYMEAITRVGGAGARGKSDYEKLAKEIAIAIADKTKLPSVVQYMEQLVGLTQQSEQYLANVSDETRLGNVALARWGEEGGTSLLRGARGAQTWGAIGGWIAGNQDPAQKTLLYSIIARDEKYRGEVAGEALTKYPELAGAIGGKGPMGMFEWQWMREHYGATAQGRLSALRGLRERIPNFSQAALTLSQGAGISLEHATDVLSEVGKRGSPEEIERNIKEKTGMGLSEIMKSAGEREGDLRKKLATTADSQLKVSEKLASDVVEIKALFWKVLEQMPDSAAIGDRIGKPIREAFGYRDIKLPKTKRLGK